MTAIWKESGFESLFRCHSTHESSETNIIVDDKETIQWVILGVFWPRFSFVNMHSVPPLAAYGFS